MSTTAATTRTPFGSRADARVSAWAWARLAMLAVSFVWLFHDWFHTQALHSWWEKEDWGHAYLMPAVSVYLLWKDRERLLGAPGATFWPGILPAALGIVCYVYFIVGISNHMLQGYAMILALAGLSLWLLGPARFRVVFIPIAVLLLGVTISKQIMEKVTFPLQILASQGAWYVLKIVGLPGSWFMVERSGATLEIIFRGRLIPLNVAEACSGARMVIAFVALGAVVGLFRCRDWWQRVALVIMAVPVALLMNIVRVAVLGLLSMIDQNLARGDAHMFIGTILLVPGLFLFLGVVWVLERLVKPAGGVA